MDIILVIAGLVLLFLGGEALIRGSVAIATKLRVSKILIGVVVVGFGTSAPELLVSIKASLAEQPDIAVGNVVGSNIANILLILGLTASIAPVVCNDRNIYKDCIAVIVSGVVLWLLSLYGNISELAGLLMFFSLACYLAYSCIIELKNKTVRIESELETIHEQEANEFANQMKLPFAIFLSVLGMFMLVFGADFLVEGASNIARQFGVSEAVIGLSLVAVGTSLPELATAISASINKHPDVMLGNVLGSNLFNIFSILSITAMIKPVSIHEDIAKFDIPFSLVISVVLFVIILRFKYIGRLSGVLFFGSYVLYIARLYMINY